MARIKVFKVLVFLALVSFATSSKLIYRKYEKKHPKRNYVQIVEIFETRQEPPSFSESDKDVNDFLARDAFKSDMNCTKPSENETTTTSSSVTYPTIPTTAYRRSTTPKTPNLNELFTIPTSRTTRPTYRPNPPENVNPDYTNVTPWTNVQVTKHSKSTNTPTILIIEPDDHPNRNRTTLSEIDNEFRRVMTTVRSTTEADEEIYYKTSEEKEADDYYDDRNYDVIPPEDFDQKEGDIEQFSGEYDGGDYDGDEYEEMRRRRKRQKIKASLKRKRTRKTQSII